MANAESIKRVLPHLNDEEVRQALEAYLYGEDEEIKSLLVEEQKRRRARRAEERLDRVLEDAFSPVEDF
jgi:RecB family endonuclease NucS